MNNIVKMLLLICFVIIIEKLGEERFGDDWLLKIMEESFYEVGDYMWVCYCLDILEISVVYLLVGFCLLLDRNTLAEEALSAQILWSIFEIVDQYLKNNWYSHFSNFIGINIEGLFRNQCLDVFLKLLLFHELRLGQVLALKIYSVVIKRSSSLVFIRKL